MKKKFILLFLVLTMTLGLGMHTYAEEQAMDIPSVSLYPVFTKDSDVSNADELRQQVNNKTAELEQIYGIKIVFEGDLTRDGYLSTQLNYLSLLEEAITEIPAELYSSARAQLAVRGKILTVCFFQGGNSYNYGLVREAGLYIPDIATIRLNSDVLYLYPSELIKTFLHEYGHMLHFTLLDFAAIEGRWTALNGGMEYNNEMWFAGDTNASKTFITDYAYSSYSEDFAESFAYLVGLPADIIKQEAMNDPGSPIIQKLLLLREILSESFSIDPLILLPF